jgi:hypothetical protein
LLVGEIILGQFRSLGVQVIAADSGTDLTVADNDPTRTLIRQILGAVAQFEKECVVLKLRSARDRKRRRQGRCEGRKAFGDRPEEATALKRIEELRSQGLTYPAIANVMNSEGLSTRSGRPWSRGTIYAICKRKGWCDASKCAPTFCSDYDYRTDHSGGRENTNCITASVNPTGISAVTANENLGTVSRHERCA